MPWFTLCASVSLPIHQLAKAENPIRVISFLSHLEKLDVYQKLDTAQNNPNPLQS